MYYIPSCVLLTELRGLEDRSRYFNDICFLEKTFLKHSFNLGELLNIFYLKYRF